METHLGKILIDTHTHTPTHRLTDIDTYSHTRTRRQTDRLTHISIHSHTDRQTDIQTNVDTLAKHEFKVLKIIQLNKNKNTDDLCYQNYS